MAYEDYPSAWKAKESSEIVFSKNELPTAENSYALCKVCIQTSNSYDFVKIYTNWQLVKINLLHNVVSPHQSNNMNS